MTRKLISLLLALLLCASLGICAYAAPSVELVFDEADLLSGKERWDLSKKLEEISEEYKANIYVVTLPKSDNDDMDDVVEDIYDDWGLGYGRKNDGVLLLVCMDPREYRILSNGFAADAITMDAIEKISDAIVSDLSDGNYADAFDTYAENCVYYLDGHVNGFPFDMGKNLLIALVIGLIAAFIVTGILRAQLKSVRRQDRANVYVKSGSMQLTLFGDYFMYRNISRRAKQTSSSSSSGSSRNVGGGKF